MFQTCDLDRHMVVHGKGVPRSKRKQDGEHQTALDLQGLGTDSSDPFFDDSPSTSPSPLSNSQSDFDTNPRSLAPVATSAKETTCTSNMETKEETRQQSSNREEMVEKSSDGGVGNINVNTEKDESKKSSEGNSEGFCHTVVVLCF